MSPDTIEKTVPFREAASGRVASLKALFDTGATYSHISEEAVREHFPGASVIRFSEPVGVPTGKKGVEVETLGVVALDFRLNGCGPVVPVPFYVTRDLARDVLVGALTMESLGLDVVMDPRPGKTDLKFRRCPPRVSI